MTGNTLKKTLAGAIVICFLILTSTAIAQRSALDASAKRRSAQRHSIQPRKSVPGLKQGDTIMLVAPARGVSESTITRTKSKLEEAGFNVIHAEDLSRQRGYLAGSDERRAAELMAAFRNPQVDAIFPITGGYGCTRILDRLDWNVIRDNPKLVIGFSDITALHLAIAAKTDFVSLHSPNGDGGWGGEQPMQHFTEQWFWKLAKTGTTWPADGQFYTLPPNHGQLESLSNGVATGPLIGGNLTLVASLMGTPYEIQTEGRVVFLEDVHEAPYRVDRYLSQLKLAGKLNAPAAVLLGQFTDADPDSKDAGLSMEQVFADYFSNAPYPVIANFPAGHHRFNATLPMGCNVEVDATRLRVRILQSPVR